MSKVLNQGTAFTGYVQLTNGAPGPSNITIRTTPSGGAYTLGANDRVYITGVAISSNDTASPLVSIDLGAGTSTVVSAYVGSTFPAYVDNMSTPPIVGKLATLPRASATAVTAGKTVEVKIIGFVSQT